MNQQEEWRAYLKAAGDQPHDGADDHLREDELIAYAQGQLDGRREEPVRAHFAACAVCREALQDARDFCEPARPRETAVSEFEIRRAWKTFQPRVAREPLAAPTPEGKRVGLPSRRVLLALAASVILAFGLTLIWALALRQEKQQLARRLQNEQQHAAERLQKLEQEKREWQAQASALQQKQEQLAQLNQPELNAPIYDLLSRDFTRRSSGESEVNRITAPATANHVILILNGEGQAAFPDYRLEIVNSQGQIVWQGSGLQRDGNGNYVVTLSRTFLTAGRYRLKLYGQRAGRAQMLAEYVVVVE